MLGEAVVGGGALFPSDELTDYKEIDHKESANKLTDHHYGTLNQPPWATSLIFYSLIICWHFCLRSEKGYKAKVHNQIQ